MISDAPAPDRRLAQKQRTRQQILDAAVSLVGNGRAKPFTVDELVDAADVSRRTIFNHFETLDEILIAIGIQRLDVYGEELARRFREVTQPLTAASALGIFAQVLDNEQMPDTIVYFVTALGFDPDASPKAHQIFHGAFSQLSDSLSADMLEANPASDRFDADLVLSMVVSGMEVVARHWLSGEAAIAGQDCLTSSSVNGDTITPEARRRFRAMFARLAAAWSGMAETDLHTH